MLVIFLMSLISLGSAQKQTERKTENVFIITLDGLRWQELFGGADDSLIVDTKFVKDTARLKAEFWAKDPISRRKKLMPWVWTTMAKNGVILGNRNYDNKVNVTNMMWFSYPGYNEILVGYSDPNITSNDTIYNPNITILEWLDKHECCDFKVAAFASWDVFPYILNKKRSEFVINAGFQKSNHLFMTEREMFLNELQDQLPSPWPTVRLDGFTHHYAKEFINSYKPNVVFISYGETDDFAHDSKYDQYLYATRNTDRFIQDLWEFCQNDEVYKGKTSFIITTDHGRGDLPKKEWTSHGKVIKGSNEIWMMAIGPDTPAMGEVKTKAQHWQNQIAATVAGWLGLEYKNAEEAGKPVKTFFINPGK